MLEGSLSQDLIVVEGETRTVEVESYAVRL